MKELKSHRDYYSDIKRTPAITGPWRKDRWLPLLLDFAVDIVVYSTLAVAVYYAIGAI